MAYDSINILGFWEVPSIVSAIGRCIQSYSWFIQGCQWDIASNVLQQHRLMCSELSRELQGDPTMQATERADREFRFACVIYNKVV